MKYVVDVNGSREEVELSGSLGTVSGQTFKVSLQSVGGTPIRLLRIGDRVHRLVVARFPERGRYLISVDGQTYDIEALDERTRSIRDLTAASKGTAGPVPLRAPMPGLIVRVLVGPGDSVSAGQGIVVMEAMKMENELRAPAGGTVSMVHAAPGKPVEKGALLVEFSE
jgi:biotin carboxyl carrier protein